MSRLIGWLALMAMGGCATSAATMSDDDCVGCSGDDVESGDAGPADATPVDAAPPPPPCTPSAWTIEPIDAWSETVVVGPVQPSLRLSDDGAVDVAYLTRPYHGGPRRFGHRAASGGWSIEEVAGTADGNVVGAITDDGLEHACFTERAGSDRLVCTERAPGAAWQSHVVDDHTTVGVSLAAAPDGTLYLTYSGLGEVGLAIRPPSGSWELSSLELAPLGARLLGPIAFDAAGCLHTVVRAAAPSTAIDHAVRCGDAGWTLEPVVASSLNPTMTARSLAIDSHGVVHFLYVEWVEAPSYHLFHARRALDGAWTIAEVPGLELYQYGPSLAIGPDEVAHAVFVATAPGDHAWRFYHLRLDDDAAVPEPFGPSDLYGGSTDTAIDATGAIHVVLDHDAKRLDYARACLP